METDNLVLEHLRAIRGTLDRLVEDVREVKGRLGILEGQVGSLMASYANMSNRIDRIDDRLARVEKRLDIVQA